MLPAYRLIPLRVRIFVAADLFASLEIADNKDHIVVLFAHNLQLDQLTCFVTVLHQRPRHVSAKWLKRAKPHCRKAVAL